VASAPRMHQTKRGLPRMSDSRAGSPCSVPPNLVSEVPPQPRQFGPSSLIRSFHCGRPWDQASIGDPRDALMLPARPSPRDVSGFSESTRPQRCGHDPNLSTTGRSGGLPGHRQRGIVGVPASGLTTHTGCLFHPSGRGRPGQAGLRCKASTATGGGLPIPERFEHANRSPDYNPFAPDR
jgi:hypothetical protein